MNMRKCKNAVFRSVLVMFLGVSSGCGSTAAVQSVSEKETSVEIGRASCRERV